MSEKARLRAVSELALMGKYVPVKNEDEVRFITNYILTVLNKEEFLHDFDIYGNAIHRYTEDNVVTHIGTNVLCGMRCITFCIENPECPKPFEEDYGTGCPCSFCYVFNVDAHETCSEFGDVFFNKNSDGYYHRCA